MTHDHEPFYEEPSIPYDAFDTVGYEGVLQEDHPIVVSFAVAHSSDAALKKRNARLGEALKKRMQWREREGEFCDDSHGDFGE